MVGTRTMAEWRKNGQTVKSKKHFTKQEKIGKEV